MLAELPRKPHAAAQRRPSLSAARPDRSRRRPGNRSHAENVYRRQAGAAGRRRGTTLCCRPTERAVGHAGLGNRKDIRNAVEAASKATGWAGATAHNRAQVLYYIAENLIGPRGGVRGALRAMTGAGGREEVDAAIRRLFFYAGFADKYDGAVACDARANSSRWR